MLDNLRSKSKRITSFNLLPHMKNCVLVFRLVKAMFTWTSI
jgi:hypothetical protein